MHRLKNFAAASLAAAGLALTPAPAAADGEDIAKIIAGIAVVGIVAKVIDDRKDRKKARRAAAEAEAEANRFGRFGPAERGGRRVIEGTIRPYHRNEDRLGATFGRNYKQQALPEQCLLRIETARGERLAYGARCLDDSYRYASRLPQSCETAVRTPRGFRNVYGAHCLAQDGWRVAHR